MCMHDNVHNNFVLPALHSEASPPLCILCPSWWPCTSSKVGASTPPVGQEASKIFSVPFDHSGHAWGGCEMMHASKYRKGKVGQSLYLQA